MKKETKMTLQEIFNAVVMNDELVSVMLTDRKTYDSLRVALVRKFSNYRAVCQQAGIESYDGRFLSCTYLESTASFSMKWKEESKRVAKDYQVLKL